MKTNKEWHLAHPMVHNATLQQRIIWHVDHQRNCNCRPIPDNLLSLMNKDIVK